MTPQPAFRHRPILVAILGSLASASWSADKPAPPVSAADLAAQLSAQRQDGDSLIRVKMEVKPAGGRAGATLQLQIKSRATSAGTDLVYRVLFPKERKDEAVVLSQTSGHVPTGFIFLPPATVRPIKASQVTDALFGGDLTFEDVIENFFAWDQQTLIGSETVDHVPCQILESKPGKDARSACGSVRAWVDVRRLVPIRVEKYSPSGQLLRRIETTRVTTDDKNRHIPANLTITNPGTGSVTEMHGSSIKHDIRHADQDFTPEGIMQPARPPSEPR